MNIALRNLKENGKPVRIVGKDAIGHPRILAGKMTRPDTLSWSAYGDGSKVVITGLWRGNPSYGEVVVHARELYAALVVGGFQDEAGALQRARDAWSKVAA